MKRGTFNTNMTYHKAIGRLHELHLEAQYLIVHGYSLSQSSILSMGKDIQLIKSLKEDALILPAFYAPTRRYRRSNFYGQ